jgi:ParE toxin of type II toxin-antitoxin system, parDE
MNTKSEPDIHPAADADIDRQFETLHKNYCSSSTLNKFLDAIGEAKRKIRDNPETWSKVSGSKRVRKVQIKDFRMIAFYIIRANGVPLILEFAGPGLLPRWAERLREG